MRKRKIVDLPDKQPAEPEVFDVLSLVESAYTASCDESEVVAFVAQYHKGFNERDLAVLEAKQTDKDPNWKNDIVKNSKSTITANAKVTLAKAVKNDDVDSARLVLERRAPGWNPKATLEVLPPGSNALTLEEVEKVRLLFPKNESNPDPRTN